MRWGGDPTRWALRATGGVRDKTLTSRTIQVASRTKQQPTQELGCKHERRWAALMGPPVQLEHAAAGRRPPVWSG